VVLLTTFKFLSRMIPLELRDGGVYIFYPLVARRVGRLRLRAGVAASERRPPVGDTGMPQGGFQELSSARMADKIPFEFLNPIHKRFEIPERMC
jgi:hypothetical protein